VDQTQASQLAQRQDQVAADVGADHGEDRQAHKALLRLALENRRLARTSTSTSRIPQVCLLK
jgi:hypothetical protein